MDDRAAFLATIAATPDDDLPRLVFADWLDEHDDSDRAEFIRVQCELARPEVTVRHPALREREAALLAANRTRWEVPGLRGRQTFHRGFIESIETAAVDLLAAIEDVTSMTVLRSLRLVAADGLTTELAPLPLLARIESLDIGNNSFGAAGRLAALLNGGRFDRLRSLSLRNNQLWPWHLEELVRCRVVSQLTRLDLSGNPIGDAGAEILAGSSALDGLSELIVPSFQIEYEYCIHSTGANAIANSRHLKRLRVLDLGDQFIGDAGLIDIVRSPNAATLEPLLLTNNEIGATGESGIEALVESPYLGKLRTLDLSTCEVDVRAATALANGSRLAEGVTVYLDLCVISPMAREILAKSPHHQQLRVGR